MSQERYGSDRCGRLILRICSSGGTKWLQYRLRFSWDIIYINWVGMSFFGCIGLSPGICLDFSLLVKCDSLFPSWMLIASLNRSTVLLYRVHQREVLTLFASLPAPPSMGSSHGPGRYESREPRSLVKSVCI
jgi:hypothetical protein